jgi:hypothetical protein
MVTVAFPIRNVTIKPYGFIATIDAHKVQKEHFGA